MYDFCVVVVMQNAYTYILKIEDDSDLGLKFLIHSYTSCMLNDL